MIFVISAFGMYGQINVVNRVFERFIYEFESITHAAPYVAAVCLCLFDPQADVTDHSIRANRHQ